MRDSLHNVKVVSAIDPATYSDDAAGATVDRAGFNEVMFALTLGVGGITFTSTNRIDFILEHSHDGITWEAVGADNVLGAVPLTGGIVRRQNSAHAALAVYRYGYVDGTIGQRRYVRLRADFNGTHATGTPISAVAVLGGPASRPVA